MNNLTNVLNAQTQMTSLQIAELTSKRHDHVLRDIDDIALSLTPNLGLGLKSTTYN